MPLEVSQHLYGLQSRSDSGLGKVFKAMNVEAKHFSGLEASSACIGECEESLPSLECS